MDITAWNKAAAELGLGLYWVGDHNSSNTADINEVNDIAGIYKDTKGKALPAFARDVALIEQLLSGANPKVLTDSQRALLQKEAGFRTVALRETYLDAEHYTLDERRMVLHLLRAIRILEDIYRWQVDPKNSEYARAVSAQKDAVAIRHFVANHGPHCLRVKDPECSALPSHPVIIPGAHLYLTGMTPETFRKLPEVLRSPYAMLQEKNGATVAVPYVQDAAVRPFLVSAAMELRKAAGFVKSSRAMMTFKAYLLEAAKAMESGSVDRPFHKAHQVWARVPSDFKWALQFGPMEIIGGDGIRGHYGYQSFFGRTSTADGSPMGVIERYGIQRMESELAALSGQKPRTIAMDAINRVRVVVPIMVAGNARPPFGSIGGFAAPNDEMERLSWVIQNENAESLRRMKASVTTHLGGGMAHFLEIGLATFNTALHEQAHKLLVQRMTEVTLKSGEKTTAHAALGEQTWSVLEECKASLAPFWLASQMQRATVIGEEKRDGLAIAQLSWVFFWLNQSPGQLDHLNIYPAVATMMFGHFVKEGVLSWNTGKAVWDVVLDDMAEKSAVLLKEIVQIQAAGDKAAAEVLIARYVSDSGLAELRQLIVKRSRAAAMPPPMTLIYAVGMDE